MDRNPVETIMGAVVLLVAAFFLVFAWNTSSIGAVKGYRVSAAFFKVGGLDTGADVRISGVKVGTVVDQTLDKKTFDAVVTISLKPDVKLPADTVARVSSAGLLGGKYVKLEPGKDDTTIPTDGTAEIARTEDFKSLEDMVGDIIFMATQDGQGGGL